MNAETAVKIGSLLLAVVTLVWGVVQYTLNARQQTTTRRVEATKPFLERQLALYTEATKTAAVIAAGTDAGERNIALARFWQLYWGELALVEDAEVEGAMVNFGRELQKKDPSIERLTDLSLLLAHACRNSLARSWGVSAWESPHWWQPSPAVPSRRR